MLGLHFLGPNGQQWEVEVPATDVIMTRLYLCSIDLIDLLIF
jgi:hypothetical protein